MLRNFTGCHSCQLSGTFLELCSVAQLVKGCLFGGGRILNILIVSSFITHCMRSVKKTSFSLSGGLDFRQNCASETVGLRGQTWSNCSLFLFASLKISAALPPSVILSVNINRGLSY